MFDALDRALTVIVLLAGPAVVNYVEWENRYPWTAAFAGLALMTLYLAISGTQKIALKVHKMIWQMRFPDEPWE